MADKTNFEKLFDGAKDLFDKGKSIAVEVHDKVSEMRKPKEEPKPIPTERSPIFVQEAEILKALDRERQRRIFNKEPVMYRDKANSINISNGGNSIRFDTSGDKRFVIRGSTKVESGKEETKETIVNEGFEAEIGAEAYKKLKEGSKSKFLAIGKCFNCQYTQEYELEHGTIVDNFFKERICLNCGVKYMRRYG